MISLDIIKRLSNLLGKHRKSELARISKGFLEKDSELVETLRGELVNEIEKVKKLETLNYLLLKEIKKKSKRLEVPTGSSGEIINERSTNNRNKFLKVNPHDKNLRYDEIDIIKTEERNLIEDFEKNQCLIVVQKLRKSLRGSLYTDYFLNLKFNLIIPEKMIKTWNNIYFRVKSMEGLAKYIFISIQF